MDILDEEAGAGLYIDNGIEESFKESARWAKFISVAGMLISGIIVVMSFTIGGRIESALNEGYLQSGGAGFLWILVILLAGVSLFILSLYMYRFATKMQTALHTSDQYEFVASMKNLRNTYKAIAITFTIYFLLFIGAGISDFFK